MKYGKYFIFIFIGVLILFAGALYAIYSNVEKQTIQDLNNNQKIYAQQAAKGIRDNINSTISMLKILSLFPEIIESNSLGRRMMSEYQMMHADEIKGITRVSAEGKIVYTVPLMESIGKDISYQDHIRLGMKTHEVVVSDVFTAVQGFRTVAVHVPVFKNGIYDGSLAFLISFDKIAEKYIENIHIGVNGYAWVVSEKGIEISCPFREHIDKNVYQTYNDFPEIISMIHEMLKGKEGSTVYHYFRSPNAQDTKVLKHAVYMPINFGNTFWSIVVATPEDEALASLAGFRTNLFVITFALLMICVICMYLIVRYQVISREQRKIEAVLAALQDSESHYRYLFEQNPVPMLIYELASLRLLAVNDAFAAHYGYSKTEAMALFLPDLYPENEKEAIVDLSKQLKGHAYAGEWHHIKKDSTQITIEARSHGFTFEGRPARIAVINDITKRKEIEEALHANELSLEKAQALAHMGNWELDPITGKGFWSKEMFRLFHCDPSKGVPVLEQFMSFIHPDDRKMVLEVHARVIETRKSASVEYRVHSEDYGEKYYETTIHAVNDAEGKLLHLSGTVFDITERKHTEDALLKSEELYRAVFENTGTASVLIEDTTVISLANAEYEKLSQYPKHEIEGKMSWTEFVVREDLEKMKAQHALRRETQEKALKQYEFRFVRKDGTIRHILLTIDVIPGTKRSVASLLDITERKQAELEIRKANRVYAVLSKINEAIVQIKEKDTLFSEVCRVAVDDGKFRMAWIGLIDSEKRKVLPVASAGFTDNYLATINIDLHNETLSHGPTGRTIKTGKYWISNDIANNPDMAPWRENALRLGYRSSAAFPIKPFGNTIGALMLYSEEQSFFNEAEVKLLDEMAKDISFAVEFKENEVERRKNEEEIRKLNAELEHRVKVRTAQLEASNKELEAFSYSVSHDLRAPLRHASGYVDLLLKKCKADLSEKGQHYLDSISDSVHQMGLLIDDLLQFSRTGRAEMRQSETDMNKVVHDVIEMLRRDHPNRTIDWNIENMPQVFCDESMIKLVWMNLLSNAVKYSKTREKSAIDIGVRENETEYEFSVRDNGVGFDMQYAQKLFGVFQRLHSLDEYEGTGIGLANVRRIITRHEGRTWAEAELDKGAIFYFTLPKKIQESL